VPPYEILRTLRAAGFQPLAPPLREGTTYVVRALDFRGVPVPGRGRCPFRCHPRCQPHRCRSGTLSLRAGILWPARSTALSARRYRTRLRSALHRRVRNIIRSTSYRAHSRAIAASAAWQSRCDHCEGKKPAVRGDVATTAPTGPQSGPSSRPSQDAAVPAIND